MVNWKKRLLVLMLIHAMLVMEIGLIRVKSAELPEEAGGIAEIEVETGADEPGSIIESSIAQGSETAPEQMDESVGGNPDGTEYQKQQNEADDFAGQGEDTASSRDTQMAYEEKLGESAVGNHGSIAEYREQQNEADGLAGQGGYSV